MAIRVICGYKILGVFIIGKKLCLFHSQKIKNKDGGKKDDDGEGGGGGGGN